MDARKETTDAPGRHKSNQELRTQGAATAWKRDDNQQEVQEDHWAGNREVSSRNSQRVVENQELDLVEELTPSEMKKEKKRQCTREEPVI
jgi:hypothetical protein